MYSDYCKRIKSILKTFSVWHALFAVCITFAAHGDMLFSELIGIDTEMAILGRDAYYIQGRPGVMWIRDALTSGRFNIYYTQILTFLKFS